MTNKNQTDYARVEALLWSASDFEPGMQAPPGMADRALHGAVACRPALWPRLAIGSGVAGAALLAIAGFWRFSHAPVTIARVPPAREQVAPPPNPRTYQHQPAV